MHTSNACFGKIYCCLFCKHINLSGILENKHRLRQSKSLPEDAASFDHNWIGTDVITIDFEHQNYNRNKTTAGGIQFWYLILCPLKARLISKGYFVPFLFYYYDCTVCIILSNLPLFESNDCFHLSTFWMFLKKRKKCTRMKNHQMALVILYDYQKGMSPLHWQ